MTRSPGAAVASADSPDPAALQYPGVATASPSALPAMLAALQAENALLRTTVAQHRAAYRDQQQATLLLTTELAEARRAFVAELAGRGPLTPVGLQPTSFLFPALPLHCRIESLSCPPTGQVNNNI